jgi:hypothetical protein
MNIATVKKLIQNMKGISLNQQRLLFARNQLEDEKILEEYDVQVESTIHLV